MTIFFFFVKRGVVIETLIDSSSGELQIMKPLKLQFLIFTIGFKCSYYADYNFDFDLSENRFKK